MLDWFEWNGVRCTEYVVHVKELPPITLAAERASFTNVPGRSGSLTTLEGDDIYDDLILPVICVLDDLTKISAMAKWLRGGGKICFANRQGGFYYGRVINQIPFEKILRGNPHREFAVNFRCKPFWYEQDPQSIIFMTSSGNSGSVTNPGNVPSEPIISLTGTGEITLIVGMTIIELTDMSGSITIDSTLQEAYNGVNSMNNHMSGDFPVLLPGVNMVSWTGNVSSIQMEPNWRHL